MPSEEKPCTAEKRAEEEEKKETTGRILGMDANQFEFLVGEAVSDKFHMTFVSLHPVAGKEQTYVAQCKDILDRKASIYICARDIHRTVTPEEVEEFMVSMSIERMDKGLFATITDFTRESRTLAKRHHNVQLLSGDEINGYMERYDPNAKERLRERKEARTEHAVESFVVERFEEGEKEFFGKRRKRPLPFMKSGEKLHSIDKRSRLAGVFAIHHKKKVRINREEQHAYVDLASGEIYKVIGRTLFRDRYLKDILELPKNVQEVLFAFIEHKKLPHGEMPEKEIKILKKKGFIGSTKKQSEGGLMIFLLDEILSFLRIFTDSIGEIMHMRPSSQADAPGTISGKTHMYLTLREMKFRPNHNIENYIDKSGHVYEKFAPDETKYPPQEIRRVLDRLLPEYDVEFKHVTSIPYYDCSYEKKGFLRRESDFTLSFKKHYQKDKDDSRIYRFIDKAPEIPFLFLALLYGIYVYPDAGKILQVFNASFLAVIVIFSIGLILKAFFKTERKVPYTDAPIVKYGFPSMHSLVSVGAVAFVYFIPEIGPIMSVVSIPLGILYIYSRIKLGVHSVTDVAGGAVIGTVLGTFLGYLLLSERIFLFSETTELVTTVLFFILPAFSIWYRMKTHYI